MAQYWVSASDADALTRFAKLSTLPGSLEVRTESGESVLGVSDDQDLFRGIWSFPEAGSPAEFEIYAEILRANDTWELGAAGLIQDDLSHWFAVNYAGVHALLSEYVVGSRSNVTFPKYVTDYEAKTKIRLRCEGGGTSKTFKLSVWPSDQQEPEAWSAEISSTAQWANGSVGLFFAYSVGGFINIAIGTNGDPAPTGPVSGGGEEKSLSQAATGSDSWTAQCQAPALLTAGAIASDTLSTIAAVSAGIVASAQASDQAGDSPVAVGSLQSGATGNDTADALADAAASLTAGAAAGERWTVQAQVLVDLLNEAAASDTIRRAAEDARQSAMAEQSQASDQFLSAIQALAEFHSNAQVSDVLTAVVAQLASISSGAIASDQFRTSFGFTQTISDGALAADTFGVNFGFRNALQSGALSADVWGLMVNMTAALSEVCTASDLVTALVDTRARVTAGAIATSRFAIVNAGIQYLVMGAITLRTALTSKTGVNPALNHTTNIKPGN